MSFFGFEQGDLENRGRFSLLGASGLQESEDLAVYTWGEESYDGLGDSLQEGGDELNDETFGNIGDVDKDFDFSTHAFLDTEYPTPQHAPTPPSLESIWNSKASFSLLNRPGAVTSQESDVRERLTTSHQHSMSHGGSHEGIHTLQDIEAHLRSTVPYGHGPTNQTYMDSPHFDEELILAQREEEMLRQQAIYQQEQLLYRQQLLQQRNQQPRNTPPPRLHALSQSPRFLEQQQRQIVYLQQQQEHQEMLRLQELQEQLRLEGIERQLRAQQLSQSNHASFHLPQESYVIEKNFMNPELFQVPSAGTLSQLSVNSQSQQRLLGDFPHSGSQRETYDSQLEQEALQAEAMRKILETEKMEEKRRRKAAKIAHMARYNDLMTQSDKDFITRIQVSQLVTQDPYADDFYAQVYGAIIRSRLGLQSQDERVLKFGSGLGVGLGLAQKTGARRPNAIQRMEQQVERIVSNARKREEEKGQHSFHTLQGALGRTSGRSYKAAPRQLLQVDANNTNIETNGKDGDFGAAAQAAKLGREALENVTDTTDLIRKDPLSQRQILIILENLYDLVLKVEQLRRDQPSLEDVDAQQFWKAEYEDLVNQIWASLKIMVPVATSNPHPFISLISAGKGKRLLPRITRHLNSQRMLTMLTLLVACFSQLDVVIGSSILDSFEDSRERADVERQTTLFSNSVIQGISPTIARATLRLVTGLLGLFLDRNDILMVAKTRPGLALLTSLITRAEIIKQSISTASDPEDTPTGDDANQWQLMFDHLFRLLSVDFKSLFPSSRIASHASPRPASNVAVDVLDQPVWQFLATFALHASPEQHQVLVAAVREKVLENVLTAKKGWVADEQERRNKLANVDLFLNALGLDSSQITM